MRLRTFLTAVLLTGALAACSTSRDDDASMTGNGGGVDRSGMSADQNGMTATSLDVQKQELSQQVGDTIHFVFDSSDINGEATAILQRQAAYMQKYPNLTFSVEGHCDQRGTREYNLALGERRANSAKSALISLGINGQRLQTISYGKERPVAVGSTDSASASNRRAVTVIN